MIPAVDVVGTEAVRLRQGDFDEVVAQAGDPADLVAPLRRRAAAARARGRPRRGPERDGSGRSSSARLAAAAAPTPVQASGGIRSLEDAQSLLDAGAARVVVGTAAFELAGRAGASSRRRSRSGSSSPSMPRGGRVAVAGWSRMTELSPDEFAERCAEAGVRRLLCTAIERDGTMAGPDLDLLERVRERSGLPVLAAGGRPLRGGRRGARRARSRGRRRRPGALLEKGRSPL